MFNAATLPRQAAHKFVEAAPPDFWSSVGIFEQALRAKGKAEELLADLRRQLQLLGAGNLRLLCEKSDVQRAQKASLVDLADALLADADRNTLFHLREFLRRRTEAVEEVFDCAFDETLRRVFEADLSDLCAGGNSETLKPLTKLLLTYRLDRTLLLDAFYLQLWRSRATYQEFKAARLFPPEVAETLDASQTELIELVKGALSKESVRMLGVHSLPDGTVTVVLHREFNPTVKRDFREEYNVHFACGVIVFGISAARDRLVVKVGNAKLTDALKYYFEDEFKLKLKSVRGEVFSDYDAKSLEVALLGGYKEESAVQIAAASFRRSALSSRSPLALRGHGVGASVRADLKELFDSKVLQLRSLDDLESLTVLFDGKAAQVAVELVPGGAAMLKFNDAGWADDKRREFEAEFSETFGVPVNVFIDPQKLEMGGVRVVAALLGLADEEDVQPYQQEKYEELVEAGILLRHDRPARVCQSRVCRPARPVLDEKVVACPKCDRPIESCVVRELSRNQTAITAAVGGVFEAATGFSLGKPKKFEGVEYYPLRRKGRPDSEEICVLVRDRLYSETKAKFQRLGQAIAVLEAHTDDRSVYLDDEGIGRVSLAYVYTAQQSGEERGVCAGRCLNLVNSLLAHHNDRVTTAARISYEHLIAGTAGDKGNVYETEIFNLVRSILPYCYQFGREGRIEPDGFVCVPEYGQDAMEGVDAWNWSYDAKHTDKESGYDLDIGERRKIVNYIEKFRGKLAFWDKSAKLRAHVIISNNISDAKMKSAAAFIFGPDGGVKKCNADVRLVLMRQDFLTRLYELVAEKREEYLPRRPYFGGLLIALLGKLGPDGYTAVGRAEAETLFDDLTKIRPLEKAMTEAELISGVA